MVDAGAQLMSGDRSEQVRTLYGELDELPEAEWERRLEAQGVDSDLGKEVLELLRAGRTPAPLVERLAPNVRGAEPVRPSVEGYRVGAELGDGASGRVFAATRVADGARVAIKVLRYLGMDGHGGEVDRAGRFRREVRILESLDHPGIAGFVEATAAETPLGFAPALVMELVDGQPIHMHADLYDLDDERRVGLIAAVCDALVHAHERGVIHRDLKPSNVLVLEDDRPVVVDFGVAHLAAPSSDDTLTQTRDGDLLGTLAYMAPEQASGSSPGSSSSHRAPDPRSDVYSVGALLFELLTGQHPIRLQNASLTEAIQRISSVDARGLEELRPDLAGDLATILGRALAKDPDGRYGSAAALGADLRRYLAQEAIEAKPFGALELAARFARRHRALTAAVFAVFVGLVVGAVGLGIGLVEARAAKGVAERSAVETSEILGAVVDVLHAPFVEKRGHQVTVSELLDEVGPKLLAAEHFSPETAAAVHRSIGESLRSLGRPEEAREHLGRAVAAARDLGSPVQELAALIAERAEAERETGDMEVALESFASARRLRVGSLGEDDPAVHATDLRTAFTLAAMGRYVEAVRLAESAHGRIMDSVGPLSIELDRAESVWGGILLEQGALEDGERHIRKAIAGFRARGEEEDVATSTHNLGVLLRLATRFEESLSVHEDALAQSLVVRGPEHPQTHAARGGRGMARRHLLDLEGARSDLQAASDGLRRVYGDRHEETLIFEEGLAEVLVSLGRRGEALEVSRRVAVTHLEAGRKTNAAVTSFNTYAKHLTAEGEVEEALKWLERARDLVAAQHGRLSAYAITLDTNVAHVLVSLGRTTEALEQLNEIHGRLGESQDAGPSLQMTVKANLGRCQSAAGLHRESVERLKEAVALSRSFLTEGDLPRILVNRLLAEALAKAGREEETRSTLREIRAEIALSDADLTQLSEALDELEMGLAPSVEGEGGAAQ